MVLGLALEPALGLVEGDSLGHALGLAEGKEECYVLGSLLLLAEGGVEGEILGLALGLTLGLTLGLAHGLAEGAVENEALDFSDGIVVYLVYGTVDNTVNGLLHFEMNSLILACKDRKAPLRSLLVSSFIYSLDSSLGSSCAFSLGS